MDSPVMGGGAGGHEPLRGSPPNACRTPTGWPLASRLPGMRTKRGACFQQLQTVTCVFDFHVVPIPDSGFMLDDVMCFCLLGG